MKILNQGNKTLTNVDTGVEETLGDSELRPQLFDPSQICNEIQVWIESFEQNNNDRIMKMREEMENQLDAILEEIKTNRSASTVRNPRSEMNDIQNIQPSASKSDTSIGVYASYNENSDSEDEDFPLQASKMKDLRHPAKPLHRKEMNLDATIVSEENSEEEDCHTTYSLNCVFSVGTDTEYTGFQLANHPTFPMDKRRDM